MASSPHIGPFPGGEGVELDRLPASGSSEGEPGLVSVIVLNWNAAHILPRAVDSVRSQTYASVELIVVDNGSTDGSAALLDGLASTATVVRLPDNQGFARGMNQGYDAAGGEYCVFLNCDAFLHPDFARAAVARFRDHPDVGVIAPNVAKIPEHGAWRFWEGERPGIPLPLDGGVVALTPLLRVRSAQRRGDRWRVSFKANGACPVVRRSVIDGLRARFGVGPFDPVFDTYGEDVDVAFKTWSLRWRTMFAADVVAGHVRSFASPLHLRDKRGRLRVNLVAERYINAIRHLPPGHLLPLLLVSLLEDLLLVVRQRALGDREAAGDVRTALARVWRQRHDLLRFRRHATWTRIDFSSEVYCR